jgi:type VI secretion system protein ImpE
MADADELLHAGDLAGARAALVERVRSQPADELARMFLFQLLAITGEWDKARTQVQALAQLSAEAQMLAAAYGQAIEAEAVRESVFEGKARIEIIGGKGGWAEGLADAIELIGKGNTDAGIAARDAAFDAAPDCPGKYNDSAFDWIADADARFGPAFEIIIAGRYGLVPFDAVERISSDGPVDLRDLIWYPVQLAFKSGQSVAAFLPARYPETERADDNQLRLARATGWQETAWGEAGVGQRLWTLSSGDDQGLLSLRSLVFG